MVVSQDSPAELDGVVLAMGRRVIRETHLQLIRLDELEDPLHELSASAMAFWPIVEIDDECGDVVQAMVDRLPPLYQPVHQASPSPVRAPRVVTTSVQRCLPSDLRVR